MPVRLEIAYLLIALMIGAAIWGILHLTRERRSISRRRRERQRSKNAKAEAEREAAAEA